MLNHVVKDIHGQDVNLASYAGRVLLIVNVASRCGLTPQYRSLQDLYDRYRTAGLVVLGFPANEFGGQEPGTDAEIREFCTSKYSVTFPMFSKVVVKGPGIHPLFASLIRSGPGGAPVEIGWNFTKFLVGRDGKVRLRVEPKTAVNEEPVILAVEAALGKTSA